MSRNEVETIFLFSHTFSWFEIICFHRVIYEQNIRQAEFFFLSDKLTLLQRGEDNIFKSVSHLFIVDFEEELMRLQVCLVFATVLAGLESDATFHRHDLL